MLYIVNVAQRSYHGNKNNPPQNVCMVHDIIIIYRATIIGALYLSGPGALFTQYGASCMVLTH